MKGKEVLESQLKLYTIMAVQKAIYGRKTWILRIIIQRYKQQRWNLFVK